LTAAASNLGILAVEAGAEDFSDLIYRRSVATTEFAAAFEQLVDGEVAFEDDKVAAIFHPDDRVEA
jgi:hypothetical protein